ncbi:hypothetical protein [Paenibacillus lentus]|nr:hypothetical protein [Paenibacillus lentus]
MNLLITGRKSVSKNGEQAALIAKQAKGRSLFFGLRRHTAKVGT